MRYDADFQLDLIELSKITPPSKSKKTKTKRKSDSSKDEDEDSAEHSKAKKHKAGVDKDGTTRKLKAETGDQEKKRRRTVRKSI